MTEEMIKKYLSAMRVIDYNKEGFLCGKETLTEALELLEKKDKTIEKLKSKNKELLRKLRNRVKEVKKLIKYSSYKKEFAKLNREIEKKDEIIEEMASCIDIDGLDIDCSSFCVHENCEEECIKQYFERKVRNGK